MACFSDNADGTPSERLVEFFGSGQIDQLVRNAIQLCWMALARNSRTPDELRKQIERLVNRALEDFREDLGVFGK